MPVECRGLACGYEGTAVLEDLDIQVEAAQILAILGGSGSGKSTLLRTLVGLEPPLDGEVRLFGRDLHDEEGRPRLPLLRRVGMLFQRGALFGSMSVLENVMFPLREQSSLASDVADELARAKLRQVHLEDWAESSPEALSGGQQKRVALARATVFDPPVLFCDEPGAGLDPVVSAELDQMLLELRDVLGTTIVVVTHEVESIRRLADRALMLEGGRVIDDGTIEELEREGAPSTRAFFGQVSREGSRSRSNALEALGGGSP